MKPTFEEWMLQNGMNQPDKIPPEDLKKWRAKYTLGFPPEAPSHEPQRQDPPDPAVPAH